MNSPEAAPAVLSHARRRGQRGRKGKGSALKPARRRCLIGAKITLDPARIGLIPGADANHRIRSGGLVRRPVEASAGRPRSRRVRARDKSNPTRTRTHWRREPVTDGIGSRSGRIVAAWNSGLGIVTGDRRTQQSRCQLPDEAGGGLSVGCARAVAGGQGTRRLYALAGPCLGLADGTSIRQPGGKATDWCVHGVFDLGRGGFSHLELTDKHGAESPPPPSRQGMRTSNVRHRVDREIRLSDAARARCGASR